MQVEESVNFEGHESFDNGELFHSLEEIGKNIGNIRRRYAEWNECTEKLKKLEDEMEDFRSNENNSYLLQILDNFERESRRKNINNSENENMQRFLEENPILKKYKKLEFLASGFSDKIKRLANFVDSPFSEFAVLMENEKKYILDLRYCYMLDVSDLEKEIYDFIISSIGSSYLLEIERDDLPLLMEIKERMPYEPDLSYMDPFDAIEEKYYILESIPQQIFVEFHNNVSRRRTNLVSVFSSKEQEELFAKCAKESRNTEASLICDGQEKDKTLIRRKQNDKTI